MALFMTNIPQIFQNYFPLISDLNVSFLEMRSYEEQESFASASISKNSLQIATKMFNYRYLVPKKGLTRTQFFL